MASDGPFSSAWDWGAIAAIGAIVGGAIRSVARAFTAPDTLDARFTDRQRRAQAGLEADHIIPSLARLLTDATTRLPAWSFQQTSPDELVTLLQDELSAVEYLDDLRQLGQLALDHDRITSSYSGAEQAAKVRGVAGVVVLGALAYPAFWVVSGQDSPNVWLWVLAGTAMLAVVIMVAAWIGETRLRTRLVKLCRKYEHAS